MLSEEIDGLGSYTNGMVLRCFQHGDIQYFNYDELIYWDELEEIADNHYHSMHFS